jgi:hypothetical protein
MTELEEEIGGGGGDIAKVPAAAALN